MAGQIEKMTRMRKNILLGILIGTGTAFCLNIYPTIYTLFHFNHKFIGKYRLFEGALVVWLLTILIFVTRFWLYKKKIKKDPSLQTAVYDERVKWNWLKAYRVAFFIAVGLTILWKWVETFFAGELLKLRFTLPNGPFLVLWGAIISLVGLFLFYNREAKHE